MGFHCILFLFFTRSPYPLGLDRPTNAIEDHVKSFKLMLQEKNCKTTLTIENNAVYSYTVQLYEAATTSLS